MGENFITIFWKRLVSETPDFFKIFRTIGVILGVINTFISTNPLPLNFPFYEKIAPYIATAGYIMAFMAQLTTCSQNLQDKSEEVVNGK